MGIKIEDYVEGYVPSDTSFYSADNLLNVDLTQFKDLRVTLGDLKKLIKYMNHSDVSFVNRHFPSHSSSDMGYYDIPTELLIFLRPADVSHTAKRRYETVKDKSIWVKFTDGELSYKIDDKYLKKA